jgi:hypothetical protein
MTDGGYFIYGPCLLCERAFSYNPHRVPSVFVDPRTKRPPDVDEWGERRTPTPEEVERAVRLPLCEECVVIVNMARESKGMPTITVLDGAYDLVRGLPE